MSTIQSPFQITEQDTERTSLEPADLGRWALLISGCFHLFDNQDAARTVQICINQTEA